MTELSDVSGAFGHGNSILAGERLRLRGLRYEDLPALAKWDMDPRALGHAVALGGPVVRGCGEGAHREVERE